MINEYKYQLSVSYNVKLNIFMSIIAYLFQINKDQWALLTF